MIYLIDNYDSFTFNIAQCLQELGAEMVTVRNDRITTDELRAADPEAIVISPGPGGPEDAGVSMEAIRRFGDSTPILGVCLGHQAMAAAYGAHVGPAPRLMHGKTSTIHVNDCELFHGLAKPFDACRYHSLIVDEKDFPDCLEITARTDRGEIMGLRRRGYPVYGVQFHPESVLTRQGRLILSNFLDIARDHRLRNSPATGAAAPAPNPVSGSPILKELIRKVVTGADLSSAEMESGMETIMSGGASGAQIGAFLTALKLKGETVEEIAGAAQVMRRNAVKVHVTDNGEPLIDTCGTGGDGAGTFNVSTTTAFIIAGGGVRVAKHGNRSVSSSCGSADVLRELGADLNRTPDQVGRSIEETGFGFLFAPMFHPAMKHAAGARQDMGIRTIFNVLGPLTNPAGTSCQLLGVYDPDLTEPLAYALKELGLKSALVVHGMDGLDELSVCAPTKITQLKDGRVISGRLDPEDLGLPKRDREAVKGGDAVENAGLLRDVLNGTQGARRDIALLNAGAAFIAAGKAEGFEDGLELARRSVDSGAAREKLAQYLAFGA